MGRRALYMFGAILAPGPTGQVDTGLGPKLSSGTIGYMEPTETVTAKGATLTVDGMTMDFMDAGGNEEPAEMVFYISAYTALKTRPAERQVGTESLGQCRCRGEPDPE